MVVSPVYLSFPETLVFFNVLLNKMKQVVAVNNSAIGIVIQMPFRPNRRGHILIPTMMKIKPLIPAINKDHLALSSAVKKLDVKILKPFSKKEKPMMRAPFVAISATATADSSRKREMIAPPNSHNILINTRPITRLVR